MALTRTNLKSKKWHRCECIECIEGVEHSGCRLGLRTDARRAEETRPQRESPLLDGLEGSGQGRQRGERRDADPRGTRFTPGEFRDRHHVRHVVDEHEQVRRGVEARLLGGALSDCLKENEKNCQCDFRFAIDLKTHTLN